MTVGDSGRHVQSTIPDQGPRDASGDVGKHVKGSGAMPGTGDCAGPTMQPNQPAPRGDSDNDGM